ncbi:uncharacterized protein OCT59_015622 [Rhizophagus irregularis]|nr:hypothetical protein OCT59_015622 [Rhizophagus irregularis]
MGDSGSKKKDDFAENLGDSALMVVPFAKFLPFIDEIGNFFNEIIELVEDAEHNKRICEILKNRVRVAELSVQDLREKRKDRQDFFNKINYIRLQELSIIITQIKNFLRTVEILHRDIRAENILITFNETAKLANFNSIAALSPSHKLDRIRYCAPELMKRSPYVKYDNRCEVFSFGILLWEIAEKRFPHQGNDDLIDIVDKVSNKMYREPFSENGQMPEEFKRLEI